MKMRKMLGENHNNGVSRLRWNACQTIANTLQFLNTKSTLFAFLQFLLENAIQLK